MRLFIVASHSIDKADDYKIIEHTNRLQPADVTRSPHAPYSDDPCGDRALLRTYRDIIEADEVHVWYVTYAVDRLIEIGIAIALGKPIKLLNRTFVETLGPNMRFVEELIKCDDHYRTIFGEVKREGEDECPAQSHRCAGSQCS